MFLGLVTKNIASYRKFWKIFVPIFIDRFGQLTVVLGRFIPAMRAIVPFLIGMTGMKFIRFYRASILAISVWGFGLIILTTGLSSIL